MRLLPLVFLCALAGCIDYDLSGDDDNKGMRDGDDDDSDETDADDACVSEAFPPEATALTDACDYEIGGFTPVVAWDVPGEHSMALPVVADLDGDGMPEIIVNWAWVLGTGTLAAYAGDGSGELWSNARAELGFGAHPAVADVDEDGLPEILAVRAYDTALFGTGDYAVVAWDGEGNELWESDRYTGGEFDHASGVTVSDMDADGSPEIVAGRAILNADGSRRGVGRFGRGCPADGGFAREGAQPAVADIDLDGVEEVITGNAIYDPDGNSTWYDSSLSDGAVAVANLDADDEAEFVVVSWNAIRAHDTDGTVIWGPLTNPTANIFPIPAIGDVDNDGEAEIVVAGGDMLWVLNADGSELWTARAHDMSGATGAALFDFDADGVLEIVYKDELSITAFNGTDGAVKFQTTEHASATMYDYPVIADVDADGHADIVVTHDGYSTGMSVYRDVNNTWAPARTTWNQHNYTITNVNDDLSVPSPAVQNFTTYNSYHSALPLEPGESMGDDLEAEVLAVCQDDCDNGTLRVTARGVNRGNRDLPAGISLALYARTDGDDTLLGVAVTSTPTPSGMTTEAVEFVVDAAEVAGAASLYVVADDDGNGSGTITECLETNNGMLEDGPFCE